MSFFTFDTSYKLFYIDKREKIKNVDFIYVWTIRKGKKDPFRGKYFHLKGKLFSF